MGIPKILANGLPGNLNDPMRAGIMPIICIIEEFIMSTVIVN